MVRDQATTSLFLVCQEIQQVMVVVLATTKRTMAVPRRRSLQVVRAHLLLVVEAGVVEVALLHLVRGVVARRLQLTLLLSRLLKLLARLSLRWGCHMYGVERSQ